MTCPQDPAQPQNRPGLASLRYRVGDHATFYQRLLDRLACPVPAAEVNQTTDLHRLTSRAEDDTILALLDAAAVVGDVLTFYQERLINEGYLRTAIERRSVLELARAIGYELSPGVAASTFLAFTVEETASAPKQVKVPKGTQVMSVPSKDELPQIFETEAEFTARVDWNSLQPRLTRPQAILPETQQLYLAGISTQLQAGDWILLMDAADPDRPGYLLSLQAVESVVAAGYTIVTWVASIPAIIDPIPREPKILAFRQKAGFFGNNAPNWADLLPDVKRAQGATLKGGIFEGQPPNPPTWISRNIGLPNADILCLVSHGDFWLAGTPVGLFRSNDNGITWEPSNTGLTNTYVQTLYSDYELNRILAGTASGGLFRSSDNGKTWVPIHTGKIISEKQVGDKFIARNYSLPDTIVRATLAAKIDRFRGQGTISSFGTTVNGISTQFSEELRINSQITVLEQKIGDEVIIPQQTFVVQSIDNNTTLKVVPQSFASRFSGVPTSHGFVQYQIPIYTPFSARNQAPSLPDINIQGWIVSQGLTVFSSGTSFQALQRSGSVPGESTITVGSQTRRITAILASNRLTINEPFVLESLNTNTLYYIDTPSLRTYFAGTDEGLYWAPSEGLPLDRAWQPIPTLQGQVVYDLIIGESNTAEATALFAATSSGVYCFNPSTKQWESRNFSHPAFCIAAYDTFLFVGTEEGVHRSPLNGSNWQIKPNGFPQNNSLPQNTRVLSLAFYKQNTTYHLFAGTEKGLYYTQDNGETWQEVNNLATRQEIPALAAKDPLNSTVIFAGSRFAGFVEPEWPGFIIPNQPIDLDGLYPKILPESEIIIVNGQAFERLQVKEVSTEPKSQFLLTNKVTRLLGDRAIAQPEFFDRRRTIVLTQSDPLALAPEQLTVEIQQDKIFQDPILSDRIYLKEFIQGLQPDQPLLVSGRHLQAQVQDIGGIFRSVKWRPLSPDLITLNVRSIIPGVADNELWIATSRGVFYSPDNGTTWIGQNTGLTNKDVRSIAINPTQTLIFIATSTTVFRATLNPTAPQNPLNWVSANQGILSQDLRAIVIHPTTSVLSIATDAGVFQSQTNGNAWEAIQSGLGSLDVKLLRFHPSSRDLYAGTQAGLFRLNAQNHWENLSQHLDDQAIHALAITPTHHLFVGTGSGVFRLLDGSSDWVACNVGLKNLNVQAIAITSPNLSPITLWIATETGIYQSIDNGDHWKLVNQGMANAQVQSLQVLRSADLVASTTTGIYRFNAQLDPTQWEQSNTGLTNTHVLAVTQTREQILLVGTREGIFRSQDGGETWEPSSEGLLNKTVQALISQDGVIIAGTADGIYRSDNNGIRWQASNTGLAHRNIQVLVPAPNDANAILAGTLNGGIFRSDDQGQTWMATRLTNTDVNAIAIPVNLSYVPTPVMLVGTVQDGLFRSTNQGNLWQQIKDIRTGTGTITSQGNTVFGKNTTFPTELKSGDRINVSGQIRTVLEIKKVPENHPEYNCLVIDFPFRPDIAKDTDFAIYTGLTNCHITAVGVKYQPGFGKLTSKESTTLQGTAAIGKLLKVGDLISAAQKIRTVTAINEAEPNQVTINQAFDPPLVNQAYTVSYLFAGTAGSGVFRSTNLGDRWEAINTNLTDLQIRCLTLSDTGELWVGTASGGIFRSINNGDVWEAVNLNLTNTDIRVLYFATSSLEPESGQIQTLLQNWLDWLGISLVGGYGTLQLSLLAPWIRELLIYLIALLSEKTLFAAGIGILRSLEDLTTVEVQPGDTLEILQVPEPRQFIPGNLQRWALQDRNGFVGVIDTTSPKILKLLPASQDRNPVSELVHIKIPPEDQQKPILELSESLQHSYDPATVKVYANVITASHGETTEEALGSGDGTLPNQQFFLKVQPLTFVSATTATGVESTLELRVDGVLWKSASSLYPLGDRDRRYIIRTEDDGSTRVVFGDGIKGARLPTGLENVTAVYRAGLGTAGNIPAERLSLLKTRPLGIQSVINPLAATGGADRESLAEARTKVPRTVRTLDRIVSLRDFEDFARTFAGIGKAQALALWNGDAQIVHVTIAGINGADIPLESSLYLNLIAAIDQARDPLQQVQVDPYEAVRFNLEARLVIDESYETKTVEAQVRSRLLDTFAFNQRRFGQAITASEAIAAIQQVPGIIAVDLDALYRLGSSKALEQQLLAQPARWDFAANRSLPAQLLLPNPTGFLFTPIPAL
ncbi:MAG: putative baseplate assembly protein [Alkalinema sp. CACIAM 70d]|nr:MAG: putative baseplate assembly protein [Alkalinema sp. CACIAM 70d]